MCSQPRDPSILKRIEISRKDLLDLSARNRLISTSQKSSFSLRIEIVEEKSEAVFQILVRDRKSMSFLPGQEENDQSDTAETERLHTGLAQPEEDRASTDELQAHHLDLRLRPVSLRSGSNHASWISTTKLRVSSRSRV